MQTTAGNCLRIFHSHSLRSRSRHLLSLLRAARKATSPFLPSHARVLENSSFAIYRKPVPATQANIPKVTVAWLAPV